MVDEFCPLPVWMRSARASGGPEPSLSEALRADAVVVGAGFTGSSTALHLAKAGKRVVQLEAREPGWGASGRAYGNVVPVSKHSAQRILQIYGRERGERLNAVLASGPGVVRSLIDEFNMDAAVDGNPWLMAAHTPSAIGSLRARHDGTDVQFLEADETAELIGSPFYKASLLDRRAMTVKPLAYAEGLARAARELGVRQFWGTPATAVERANGSAWRVSTPYGEVVCDNVFLCTNAYSDALWPGLAKSVVPIRGYCAITRPISDNLLARVLPRRHFLTDTRHLWSGIRKLPDNRLHLAAGGSSLRATAQADLSGPNRRLRMIFPHLGNVEWEGQWSGWIAGTGNHLPKILRLDDGVFSALGYNGRGIAFATLLGRELSKLADQGGRDDLILPVEELRPLPFHDLTPLVAAAYIAYYGVVDRWKVWRNSVR